MKRFTLLALFTAACGSAPAPQKPPPPADPPARATNQSVPNYPPARRDDVVAHLHGVEVSDPYRWLEDGASEEVRKWTEAQDALAHRTVNALPQRARFEKHLRQLMYAGDVHSPEKRGNTYFYWKRDAGQEKLVLVAREKGQDRVILDPNGQGPDGKPFTITDASISPSGRYIAYKWNANNADLAALRVRDVSTGKDLGEEIPAIAGDDVAWVGPHEGFYYRASAAPDAKTTEERLLAEQLKYHPLGTSPAQDALVRDRTGKLDIDEMPIVSQDGRWLLIEADHGYTRTDVYFRDRRDKKQKATWTTLVEGKDAIHRIIIAKGRFYMRTNEDAPRFHVVEVDPAHPEREHWKVVEPERPNATLQDMRVVGDFMVLQWLTDATSRLEVRDLKSGARSEVPFGSLGTIDELTGEPGDREAFVHYATFTTAPQIFEVSPAHAQKELFAEVPSAPEAPDYLTEQIFFRSKDGTRIPMFIVRNTSVHADGKRPTLLYGYGGFDLSQVPVYRPAILAWLREGGIYAQVNLRGGGEYGAAWHRDGMLDKKQNVFDDFIAAAQTLIAQGWTEPRLLAAKGRSNGGLLVTTALTQRPDLFRVVLPGVPLTDMIRFPESGAGKVWVPEYGDPHDASQFRTLLAYSPYHHIEKGRAYPSVFMLSADGDDRVDPMHARKFVAALQYASSGGPVLMSLQRNAGHRGTDAIKSAISNEADAYAFTFAEMGLP